VRPKPGSESYICTKSTIEDNLIRYNHKYKNLENNMENYTLHCINNPQQILNAQDKFNNPIYKLIRQLKIKKS